MSLTHYPGGITSFGAPVFPSQKGGFAKTLFVGAAAAGYNNGVDGESYEAPLATLKAALADGKLDEQDRGTLIVVRRGHTEDIDAADYFSAIGSRKNVVIKCEGEGLERPAFTWTAAAATWLMDTQGIVLENARLFLAGPHAAGTAITVAKAIEVSGAGCKILGSDIRFGFDADQIVTLGIVTTAAGDDFEFAHNFALGEVAAEITAAGTFLRLVGADRAKIHHNYIAGALATDTDGLIEFLTTLSSHVQIYDNWMYAQGAGNTCVVDAGAALANTGRLERNMMVVDADTTAETVVFTRNAAGNFALLDNFLVNNNNERGLVIGTASV